MKYHDEEMLAVVCRAPQDYKLENVKRPAAGPNEVIIKIMSCGICAGDCKGFAGAPRFWGDKEAGRPSYIKAPVISGHEFWGVVCELGEGAAEYHNVKMGDRVVAEQIVPCGRCHYCRTGHHWMCEVHDVYGFQKEVADGGMAEYMRLSARAIIHKIPETVSFEDAAVIEPLSCSIHAVNRGDIQFSDVVVIAGAGPLGLFMVQAAKLKTPKCLVVIDMADDRLELSKQFGADVVINPSREDSVKIVKEMTGGYGCDVYIEATGNPVGVTQGLEMIRKLGRFVEFSVFGKETTTDWSVVGDRKELDIRGAHLSPYTYPVAIDLLERGLVTSKGIVTDKYALADWEAGFARAHSVDSIKVLLVPDAK